VIRASNRRVTAGSRAATRCPRCRHEWRPFESEPSKDTSP
jgi:hypothetical protein